MTRLRHERLSMKELLKIAQDESSTPEQLSNVWDTTRSVKVRKAIASNPNANALTLRVAARLYLEEVLENPGFEMLKLFDDDNWVNKIGAIHESPDHWVHGLGYYARATGQLEPFARAALLSPQLKVHSLVTIMEFLPVSSLKRAFKYPKTRENSRKILFEGVVDFSLEGIFKGYNSGLYDEDEFYECLKQVARIGSMSCRKSTYVRAVKKLLGALDEGAEAAAPAISIILLTSRVSCVDWIKYIFDKKHLPLVATALKAAKKILKGSLSSSAAKSNIKVVSGIITGLLWEPLDFEERKKGLRNFYKSVCRLGLENHEWGNSKDTWSPVMLTNEIAKELIKEDIRVKSFFVKSKCLGNWFHVQKSDHKFRIVEEVNHWLYDRGGIENTLYKSIDLKKIISISPDVVIGF
jgi:hypothetical protein